MLSRGVSATYGPPPEGVRTSISSQRPLPSNTPTPKSRSTFNKPSASTALLSTSVEPTCVPPSEESYSRNTKSAEPESGVPPTLSRP
jgi:hypothetical protein